MSSVCFTLEAASKNGIFIFTSPPRKDQRCGGSGRNGGEAGKKESSGGGKEGGK